jgi:aryl-alcohol dehydrogenase-like predicted oxidoreductase
MSTIATPAIAQRRKLGWTDLEVAPLALGTMQLGWLLSDVESMKVLDEYRAAGGNLIETADMYGADQTLQSYELGKAHVGVTEDIIGRWLQSRGCRDEMIIATKVRARMWDGPDGEGLSRAHVERAVDDCVRRLRVDSIDLLQAHWPDPDAALEETLEVFGELVGKGKVRYVGTSNFWAFGDVLSEALEVSRAKGGPRLASESPRYNLLNRAEYEGGLQEIVLREQLGTLCYSPLAGGFLTGKYRSDSTTSVRAGFVAQYCNERGFALIDALEELARNHDVATPAVALAWLIAQPGITAAIVGANSVEQLRGWAPAAGIDLSADELDRLGQLGWEASAPEFTAW